MFGKTYGIIEFDFSGIVQTGTVHLEFIFSEPLEDSIALISLNQFETYREIISDGNVLLDLAL